MFSLSSHLRAYQKAISQSHLTTQILILVHVGPRNLCFKLAPQGILNLMLVV